MGLALSTGGHRIPTTAEHQFTHDDLMVPVVVPLRAVSYCGGRRLAGRLNFGRLSARMGAHMNAPEAYLRESCEVRLLGATVKQTSYRAVAFFTQVAKNLRPEVGCIVQLANGGPGVPDGGLFVPRTCYIARGGRRWTRRRSR